MGHNIVAVETGIPVTRDMIETHLYVEDEKQRIVLVKTFPWDSWVC
jgi:hypothetical protein